MNPVHGERGVLDTIVCDKVRQLLATGRWFSSDTSVSSSNKTEILLKVALKTINQQPPCDYMHYVTSRNHKESHMSSKFSKHVKLATVCTIYNWASYSIIIVISIFSLSYKVPFNYLFRSKTCSPRSLLLLCLLSVCIFV